MLKIQVQIQVRVWNLTLRLLHVCFSSTHPNPLQPGLSNQKPQDFTSSSSLLSGLQYPQRSCTWTTIPTLLFCLRTPVGVKSGLHLPPWFWTTSITARTTLPKVLLCLDYNTLHPFHQDSKSHNPSYLGQFVDELRNFHF